MRGLTPLLAGMIAFNVVVLAGLFVKVTTTGELDPFGYLATILLSFGLGCAVIAVLLRGRGL